jgi:energy-coupling factor transport system permease protein
VEDFEYLRHVTIGQYLPGSSMVHRLDPRTKMVVLVLIAAAITLNMSYTANIILLAISVLYVQLARVPLGYILGGVKPVLPFIAFLAAMQLLFYGNQFIGPNMPNIVLWQWGIIHVTTGSVQLVIISILRFLQLLLLASLLTNTTTTTELTHGMESLLRPLGRLGVPAHELSLVGTIALRFVPILAEQLEMIVKAQASRGAETVSKGPFHFLQAARQLAVLVVPLFMDAFRRAEDLILAMQARCYVGGKNRTNLIELHLGRADYRAIGINLVLVVLLIAARNRFLF